MKTYSFKIPEEGYENPIFRAYVERTFVKISTCIIMLATPKEHARYVDTYTFNRLSEKFCTIEGEVENYQYFKNHLSKVVKKELLK